MVPKSATVCGLFVQGIESCGFKAHGGKDSPYVYVDLDGRPSWDVFSEILEKAQVGNKQEQLFDLSRFFVSAASAVITYENVDTFYSLNDVIIPVLLASVFFILNVVYFRTCFERSKRSI